MTDGVTVTNGEVVKDRSDAPSTPLSGRLSASKPMESPVDDLDILKSTRGRDGFNEILMKYRKRLRKAVALRMNTKLQGRVDASDIIQDAYIEASRTRDSYLENPKISPFLWLRRLVGEKLIHAHRYHIGTQKRSVERDISLVNAMPAATSQSIAGLLIGNASSPSEVAVRNENKRQLMDALEKMDPVDREVLVLRHFEQLNGKEVAEIIGISHEASKKRYIRALEKLERMLIVLNESSTGLSTPPEKDK